MHDCIHLYLPHSFLSSLRSSQLGTREAGYQDRRGADTCRDNRAADGVDVGAVEGQVGGGTEEEVADEHEDEAGHRDEPGGDDLLAEVAIDGGDEHDGEGHDEEGDGHQLHAEADGLEEGGEGHLDGADVVGADGAGEEGDQNSRISHQRQHRGGIVVAVHFGQLAMGEDVT